MKRLSFIAFALLALAACKHAEYKPLPVLSTKPIPAFTFVNQYGDSTGTKNLKNKIYVADFFFTSCPSICPIMERNMLTVYNTFKDSADVKIVSFTIDPRHDTVPVLKKYADKLGVSGNSWWFLLGDKDHVYDLAAKSYLVSVAKDSTVAGGYIHQGYFILVDKKGQLRGAYDGTDMKQVNQLVDDIKTLKAEPATN